MGYGARARVQVGIRTMVEPVWNQTPSLAPVSLPFAVLGPLPCAHLAQNPPSLRRPTGLFTPDSKHRGEGERSPSLCKLGGTARGGGEKSYHWGSLRSSNHSKTKSGGETLSIYSIP